MHECPDRIPLDQCQERRVYRLFSRNLDLGVFRASTRGFIGIRTKFGSRFLFEEHHWDTGAPYGTANPLEDLNLVLPDDIGLEAERNPSPDARVYDSILKRWLTPEESQPILARIAVERRRFVDHLRLVAKAMHDVEWVDSDNYSPGDELEALEKLRSDLFRGRYCEEIGEQCLSVDCRVQWRCLAAKRKAEEGSKEP